MSPVLVDAAILDEPVDRDVSVDEHGAADAEDVIRRVPVELADDGTVRVLCLTRVAGRRGQVERGRKAVVARRVVVEIACGKTTGRARAQLADRRGLVVVVPVRRGHGRRVDRDGRGSVATALDVEVVAAGRWALAGMRRTRRRPTNSRAAAADLRGRDLLERRGLANALRRAREPHELATHLEQNG